MLDVSILDVVLLFASAVFGVLLAAYVGWAKGTADFNARKFSVTVIVGVMSALVLVVATLESGLPVTFVTCILLFLGSSGADVLLERSIKAISKD